MDSGKNLVLWVAGATGIMLVYSGIKAKTPLTLIQDWFSGGGIGKTTPFTHANEQPGFSAGDPGAMPPNYIYIQPSAQSSAYRVEKDERDVAYVYDANGIPLSVVPAAYQNSPNTYIPAVRYA